MTAMTRGEIQDTAALLDTLNANVVIEAGANPFRGMRPQLDFACLGGSAREDCSDWTYFMNAYTMAFRGRAE